MSETKHSPEPWGISPAHSGDVLEANEGWKVAECWDPEATPGTSADNARRIVACVNALAGIPTEALEAGRLAEALEYAAACAASDGWASEIDPSSLAALRALGRLP